MNDITICYSTHRPETLSLTARIIEKFDTIILEEPPHPDFNRVLAGDIEIQDHLLELEVAYPAFTLGQYRLLQQFYQAGKEILQVEPYLEHLLNIQYFLADGHSPDEIELATVAHTVYIAEREATGALLDYYKEVRGDNFERILSTMNAFAKADASRFILRDTLRAEKILHMLESERNSYIEAGSIHLLLKTLISNGLEQRFSLNTHSIDGEILQLLGLEGHLFSPGDELTLAYIFGSHLSTRQWQMLCSQSLIYSKIIKKEETSLTDASFPHTRDEFASISMVKDLSIETCHNLFQQIRSFSSEQAAKFVTRYC